MIAWLVIALMFVGVLAALAYPLVRPRPTAQAEDLDALIEQAVQARGPAPAARGRCPQCGAPARADDRFCRRCGASLAQRCPGCGAPYESGDRFCVQCGASLTEGEGV